MPRFTRIPSLAASLFVTISAGNAAQTFYVDVSNSVANPQMDFRNEGEYAHFPSHDLSGAGFSAGSGPFSTAGIGTYYTADGFLTGHTTLGLWQSSWLDALHPDVDLGPHGGLGTIDVLTAGGITGVFGANGVFFEAKIANGLEAPLDSLDTNGLYLGIAGSPKAGTSEYALYSTALEVTETTEFTFEYIWSPAGGTLADVNETELLIGVDMSAQFFLLGNTTDYSAAAPIFSEFSETQTYNGKGTQGWFPVSGNFTLQPGTYYWGFSAGGDPSADDSYIAVESIKIAPVPEPSGIMLAGLAGALGLLRRRRGAA